MVRPNAHRTRLGCVGGLCAQLLNKTALEPGSSPARIEGPDASALVEGGAAAVARLGPAEAEEDDTKYIELKDNKCPKEKAQHGWQYILPVGGWQSGDCELVAEGNVTIVPHKDTNYEQLQYFIEVGWGRNLTMIGNFAMDCAKCKCDDMSSNGTRGILSKGAAVRIDGTLKMNGFCATTHEDLTYMDQGEGETFLDDKDGGTILARRLYISPRSQVIITNSKARKGSGGALAVGRIESLGDLVVENAEALHNGGGMAVKRRTNIEKSIEYSWHIQCEDNTEMSSVTGLALDNTGSLLATATECCPAKIFDMKTGYVMWTRPTETDQIGCRPELLEWKTDKAVETSGGTQHLAIARTFGVTFWGVKTNGDRSLVVTAEEEKTIKGFDSKDEDTTDWKVSFRWSVTGELVAYAYGPHLAIYRMTDLKTPVFSEKLKAKVNSLDWSYLASSYLAVAIDMEMHFIKVPDEGKDQKVQMSEACPYLGERKMVHISGLRFRPASTGRGRGHLSALTVAGSVDTDVELGLDTQVGYLLLVNFSKSSHDDTLCPWFEHSRQRTFANNEITAMAWDPRTPEEIPAVEVGNSTEKSDQPGTHLFAWADVRQRETDEEERAKVRGGFGSKFVTPGRVTALRWHQTSTKKNSKEAKKRIILGTNKGDVVVIKGQNDSSVYADENSSTEERKTMLKLLGTSRFENVTAQEGTGGALYLGQYGGKSIAAQVQKVTIRNSTALVQGCGIQTRDGEVTLKDVTVCNDTRCLLGSKLVIALESFDSAIVRNITFIQTGGTVVYSRRPHEIPAKGLAGEEDENGEPRDPQKVWGDLCDENENVKQITCPHGQIANTSKLAADTCVVKCKSCEDGEILNPGNEKQPRRCVKCPFGLKCGANADMRNPELGETVMPWTDPVDPKECEAMERSTATQVKESYYFEASNGTLVCRKATCRGSGNWGMKRNQDCERCKTGEITRNSSDSIEACTKAEVKLVNVHPETTCGPTCVVLKGSFVPPEVQTDDINITCILCPKEDSGLYSFLPLPIFKRFKGKCTESHQANFATTKAPVKENNSTFHIHFNNLKHGFVYQPSCSLESLWGDHQVDNKTDIDSAKSKWSMPLTFADNDMSMCALSLVASLVLNWVTYDTKANWRRRRKTVAIWFVILLGCLFAGCTAVFKKVEELEHDEHGPLVFLDVTELNIFQHVVAVAGLSSVVSLYFLTEYRTSLMAREAMLKAQVVEALSLIQEVQFPMVLCRADIFLGLGELKKHEDLREDHLIRFLDTVQETKDFLDGKGDKKDSNFGIFFSHQWTSYDKPDPQGLQYKAMCKALEQLAEGRDLQKIWVWVDYFSIPQENPHTQRLAINSLPIYASSLQAFVVVAPVVVHENLKVECNRESYQSRGWCRAEQMCHYVMRGTEDMYLAENGTVQALKGCLKPASMGSDGVQESELEMWFKKMMFVFEDKCQYTCCKMTHILKGKTMKCDREALMLPMLGLYGKIYRSKNQEQTKAIYQLIKNNREDIFPNTFDFIGPTVKDHDPQRKLFEDVVDKLERTIDEENDIERTKL